MTSKLWLISSSSEAGPVTSTTVAPSADFGALRLVGAAGGWSPRSNSPARMSSSSARAVSSLRQKGRCELIELMIVSKRPGRSISGSGYCLWLLALRLTAMIMSQCADTTGTMGRGLSRPPSTSMRLPCITGVNRLGMAAEARIASSRLPSWNQISCWLVRSVATAVKGIGRSSMQILPTMSRIRPNTFSPRIAPRLKLGSTRRSRSR